MKQDELSRIKTPEKGDKFKNVTDDSLYLVMRSNEFGMKVKKIDKNGNTLKSFNMKWLTWAYHYSRGHYMIIEDNFDSESFEME